MSGYNLLWITLLLLAVQHSRRADAFQCYECEDCPTIEAGDIKYLKECVLPESIIVRPTTTRGPVTPEESAETEDISSERDQTSSSTMVSPTTTSSIQTSTPAASTPNSSTSSLSSSTQTSKKASTTTSAPTSTVSLATPSTSASNITDLEEPFASQNGTDSDDEDYELLGNSTSISEEATVKNTTDSGEQSTQSSAENSTTQKKKKGSSWSLFSGSKEQADSRSEELPLSAELSQRSARQLPGTKPMCYILTVKYDGFEVTSRGCGAALPDRNLTCKMLSKGQPYSECGLCEGSRCNSASTVQVAFVSFFLVLVSFVVRSW